MNHAEFISKAKQTFRMADEEISFGIQAMIKLFNEALLFGFIEIDHHVAAENYVVAAWQKFRLQIVEVE
jgi:hypothetical protein